MAKIIPGEIIHIALDIDDRCRNAFKIISEETFPASRFKGTIVAPFLVWLGLVLEEETLTSIDIQCESGARGRLRKCDKCPLQKVRFLDEKHMVSAGIEFHAN